MIRSRPGRIPWTAIQKWSEVHGYTQDRREMLEHCIQAMDAEFLEWVKARQGRLG